jgi:peptidoglycan hydrolase CwlO-like protein
MTNNQKHIFLGLLIGLCLIFSHEALAQNRSSLERKRAELLKEIEATSQSLAATRKDKSNTLNRFLSLQKQIRQRQALVDSYQADIDLSLENIERTDAVVNALATDLELLREEYSRIMRVALRHKLHQSYWAFLFSANSLNDAFQRWQYIRQYDQYRKRQARLIIDTQNSLSLKIKSLEAEKERKEDLLNNLLSQNEQLQSELTTKDELLKKLKSSEKQLVREIQQKEKAAQKLNAAIEAIIQAEIAAREAAAAKASRPAEEANLDAAGF